MAQGHMTASRAWREPGGRESGVARMGRPRVRLGAVLEAAERGVCTRRDAVRRHVAAQVGRPSWARLLCVPRRTEIERAFVFGASMYAEQTGTWRCRELHQPNAGSRTGGAGRGVLAAGCWLRGAARNAQGERGVGGCRERVWRVGLGPGPPGGRGRSRCCSSRPGHAEDLSDARTVKQRRDSAQVLGGDGLGRPTNYAAPITSSAQARTNASSFQASYRPLGPLWPASISVLSR